MSHYTIVNQIIALKSEHARVVVLFSEEKLREKNSETARLLEAKVIELKAELDRKVEEKKLLTDVLILAQKDNPQNDHDNATYFLNELPVELIISETPAGRSSFWTDGSSLSTRERPDVGIDLS